jgi:predicted transcriptional regulator of viral defense system
MEFERLVEIVKDEPAFEIGLLLAGDVHPHHIRRQLTRWTNAGRLYQLRRGLYALAPPSRKVKPHPFAIANRLVQGAYVSCQSALAHYGLIPDYVPTIVSVCSSRPRRRDTPLGSLLFRHVRRKYLSGYRLLDMGDGQQPLVARPEKALLDLIHLTAEGDSESYIRSLRLQNLENLDMQSLKDLTQALAKPKLIRAARQLELLVQEASAAEEVG